MPYKGRGLVRRRGRGWSIDEPSEEEGGCHVAAQGGWRAQDSQRRRVERRAEMRRRAQSLGGSMAGGCTPRK
eukprot:870113-Prymnesium_polylepis.1